MGTFVIYILTMGWIFALAIILSVALPIFIWILNKLTGEIDLWKELRKKNLAVAVFLASVILGFTLIIGLTI